MKLIKTPKTFAATALTLSLLLAACGGAATPTAAPATVAPAATIAAVKTPTTESTTAPTATEVMTNTSTMTDTTVMTSTDMMTGTGTMSGTEMMTGTGAMTGTNMMTSTEMMTGTGAMSGTTGSMNVVETAMAAGNFKTLTAALKAAGLVNMLKGTGPFTILAPTDEAFAKLPKATLDDLMKPENKAKLVKILQYHVIEGKVMSSEVAAMTTGKTVEGSSITIKVDGSTVMINNAKVITPDIQASNGVIHVIDTVLMPPMK